MQSQYHSPQSVFGEATNRSFDRVYALVSGGLDSTTAAHIVRASEQIDVDGIIYLDTGVGIPQSRQWVREWADEIGLPCHIVGSQYRLEKEEYHNLVYNFGMPPSPAPSPEPTATPEPTSTATRSVPDTATLSSR